jgi:hypothetical protein
LPGSRGDHRGIVSKSLWQFRLSQMGYGIVGFRDLLDYGADYWGGHEAEARANLQLVLDSIASSFGHPEISNAPILLDGVSKGAFSAGYLASFVPDRTLGFIADKGYGFGTVDDSIYSAPGAIIVGERDDIVLPATLHNAFSITRQFNANNAFMVDWNRGHLETTENLRLAIMDQMIRARYPRGDVPSTVPGHPLELKEPGGWLAEAAQIDGFGVPIYNPVPVIAPEGTYPLDPTKASWLPTAAMAAIYESHNDDTFQTKPVQMSAVSFFGGKLLLNIAVNGISSSHLELYRNETLVAVLDPSNGPIRFTYRPKEKGLQTFIAKARYESNGDVKYTSNYFTTVVQGVVEVPEPAPWLLCVCGLPFIPRRSLRAFE